MFRLSMLGAILILILCAGCPQPQLDCTLGNPDIQCAAGASCNPATRRCEQNCSQDADCPGSEADASRCQGGWCVQCAAEGQPGSPAELNEGLASCYCHKHADCTSGLCDVYQTRRPDKVGLCVPARARTGNSLTSSYQLIVYVDRERCQTAGEPDGTLAQPYCEIYDAVN